MIVALPRAPFTDISALRRPGAVTCVLEHSAKNLLDFASQKSSSNSCRSKSRSSEAAAAVFFKFKLTGTASGRFREAGILASSEMFRCSVTQWSYTLVRSTLSFSMKDSVPCFLVISHHGTDSFPLLCFHHGRTVMIPHVFEPTSSK